MVVDSNRIASVGGVGGLGSVGSEGKKYIFLPLHEQEKQYILRAKALLQALIITIQPNMI